MPNTTAEQVGQVIDVDDSDDITIHITTANAIVEDVLGAEGYPNERLALIEAWLAAHFYAVSRKETSMETAGSVSEQYQHRIDLMLASTMYGQQAMALDTSGKLAAYNNSLKKDKKQKVTATYYGSERTGT